MNGPLRRLARQAIGQATQRIHAPARLPYQPLPELPSETAGAPPEPPLYQTPPAAPAEPMTPAPRPRAQSDTESAPPPEHRGVEVRQPAPPPDPILSTAPGDGAPSPRPAMPARPTPDAEPWAMPPSSIQPPGPQASSGANPEGRSDATKHTVSESSPVTGPGQAGTEGRSPRQEPPPATHADEAPRPVTTRRTPVPPASPQAHSRPREPSFETPPEVLLPPLDIRSDAVRPPATGTPAAPAVPTPPPPTEPPEVHVHIGRIDVTAAPQATSAKPTAARGQPPMSLEAYLATRRRNRS